MLQNFLAKPLNNVDFSPACMLLIEPILRYLAEVYKVFVVHLKIR